MAFRGPETLRWHKKKNRRFYLSNIHSTTMKRMLFLAQGLTQASYPFNRHKQHTHIVFFLTLEPRHIVFLSMPLSSADCIGDASPPLPPPLHAPSPHFFFLSNELYTSPPSPHPRRPPPAANGVASSPLHLFSSPTTQPCPP